MSASQQAKARRRQAANGFTHIDPMKRPLYSKKDAAAAARKLAQVIATERRIAQKKK